MLNQPSSVEYLSLTSVRIDMITERITDTLSAQESPRLIYTGQGTGFFWKHEKQIFLITNLHNFIGRHFETNKPLQRDAYLPDSIKVHFYTKCSDKLCFKYHSIKLYDENKKPVWLEHKERSDVAVIPLGENKLELYFANDAFSDVKTSIGQDVFVVGYPLNMDVNGTPIWKRASIASEPQLDAYNNKKTFLIDTATRNGMSGSPVYYFSSGPHFNNNGQATITPNIARKFLGIYSCRLGEDKFSRDKSETQEDKEFKAQLGVVWKREIIDEIISEYMNSKNHLLQLHTFANWG